jgi:hypothetical protein
MAERSHLYQLIEAKLAPVTFEEFMAERRPQSSWQAIATEITQKTGVALTKEVLRRWFAGRISYDVKIAPTAERGDSPASAA